MSTTGVPLIRYIEDYEVGAVVPMKKFLVNRANGGKSEMYVAYASGNSVEFLIKECFIRIEDVREAYRRAGDPWDGPTRFYELKDCLI